MTSNLPETDIAEDSDYVSYRHISASTGPDEAHEVAAFREFLYEPEDHRLSDFRNMDARRYAEFRFSVVEILRDARARWQTKLNVPFVGVTTDGVLRTDLFSAQEPTPDQIATTKGMVEAALAMLGTLTPEQTAAFRYSVTGREWRQWSNPEILVFENGLRLEDLASHQVEAFFDLMRVSMGEEGFLLARNLMKLNAFLGTLVDLPLVMNELSYQVSLFGQPSLTEPWGWQLHGHHVALNVVVVKGRLLIGPVFLGAEPTFADEGDLVGYIAFEKRQALALELVGSMTPMQLATARLYESMRDERMAPGRLDPLDERHLAGAFQDNRVIPYEGIAYGALDETQQSLLLAIVDDYLTLYPKGSAQERMAEVEAHLDETWLAWIGGVEAGAPMYFRIQSPTILLEFDHHAGVWLANDVPATFHIHTVMRTPNGNDYGYALRPSEQC